MQADGDKYQIKQTELDGVVYKERPGILDPSHIGGSFILDGCGFLLMRYLVKHKFLGKFETYTMNITGNK